MNTVFCDTSGFYALIDPSERKHSEATLMWEALVDSSERAVTNNYVITECVSLLQARVGIAHTRTFVEAVIESVDVGWVDGSLHEAALREFFLTNRRHVSFVDCTCFAFMRRHRIDTVFTFDSHFSQHGFKLYETPATTASAGSRKRG